MALMPLMPGAGEMGPGGPTGPGPLGASPQGPGGMMPQPPPGPPGGDPLSALMGGQGPPMGGDPNSIMQLFNDLSMDVEDLARALPGSEQFAEQIMGLIQQWQTMAVVAMAPMPQQMPGAGSML